MTGLQGIIYDMAACGSAGNILVGGTEVNHENPQSA